MAAGGTTRVRAWALQRHPRPVGTNAIIIIVPRGVQLPLIIATAGCVRCPRIDRLLSLIEGAATGVAVRMVAAKQVASHVEWLAGRDDEQDRAVAHSIIAKVSSGGG